MRLFIGVIRLLVGLGVSGAALLAVAAIFGFAVPLLDILNHLQMLIFPGLVTGFAVVILVFAGSRWRRRLLLVCGIGIVASGSVFVPEMLAGLEPRPPLPNDDRQVLKLMTHNLFGRNDNMAQVADVIAAEDPDIVALQEYFEGQSSDLHPLLAGRYPHHVRCLGGKRANLGLYSKMPFQAAMDAGDCPDNAYGAQRTAHINARFTLPDGSFFSVVTSHLDWPLPAARQDAEMQALADTANAVDGPLLLVGDFNSTPWSYALRNFANATGLERQDHNLVTYPLMFTVPRRVHRSGLIDTLPFLPLDHVFTNGQVAVHELHAGAETGSDHLPVVFSFSVAPADSN